MSEILIFRFVDNEGPGYLLDFLAGRGIAHRLIAIDAGEPVPQSIDSAVGLVFMGGPMSVNDSLPWIAPILHLIEEGQKRQLPMLGHCLGGQLLAKALGAEVRANPQREIGWFDVEHHGVAIPEPYTALPRQFLAFHWHGETFAIPDGAIPLYRSAACDNQAFMLGSSLGLQFHVEMQAPMVADWARAYRAQLQDPSAAVQNPESMLVDLEQRIQRLNQVADQIYSAWLGVGLQP